MDQAYYPSGLVSWLSGTKDIIKHVRKSNIKQTKQMAVAWTDSAIQSVIQPRFQNKDNSKLKNDPPWGGCENEHEFIGPLLTTTWGQLNGYNDSAPNNGCANGDGRVPTGCVATAMAQIMRYHQFPNNYNWANMPDDQGTTTTADLMRDIGDAVNMDWGCDASSADTEDEAASSFTNDFGYSSASYGGYSSQTLKNNIRNGRPLMLRGGSNSGWWIFGVYTDGHAWVCDGFRRSVLCGEGGTATDYLKLHMNWGWNGSYNGWYNFNNWDPGSYTFNYQTGMVYNIIP